MELYVAVAGVVGLVAMNEWVLRVSRRRQPPVIAFGITAIVGYLILVVVAFSLLAIEGRQIAKPGVVVEDVVAGWPSAGKLELGDRIVAIDNTDLDNHTDIRDYVDASGGQPVSLLVAHGDAYRRVTIQPKWLLEHWRLGMGAGREWVHEHDLGAALNEAVIAPPVWIAKMIAAFGEQLRPVEPGGLKQVIEEFDNAFKRYRSRWFYAICGVVPLGMIALIVQLVVGAFRLRRRVSS